LIAHNTSKIGKSYEFYLMHLLNEKPRLFYHLVATKIVSTRYGLPRKPWIGRLRLLSFAVNYAIPEDKASSILDVGWQVIDIDECTGFSPRNIHYYKIDENSSLTKSTQQSVCLSSIFSAETTG
jgi:hypothetical protein